MQKYQTISDQDLLTKNSLQALLVACNKQKN